VKNPLGMLLNRAPVPYTSSTSFNIGMFGSGGGRSAHLDTMAAVGTVFSIVNKTSTAVAPVEWHMHRLRRRGASNVACPLCEKQGVELVEDHLALRIWNRPNDFFTGTEFREVAQQHIDLTGETWWIVERQEGFDLPLGLWPVRPDRMEPVPSTTDYLAGYIYKGPQGEKVPFGLDEVIFIRMPDPADSYRGLGPISSIMRDIDSARFSAEWNRRFFLNSAEPGGIIKVNKALSDREFKKLQARWNEQHQGITRAHRVAILEEGEWVDRKYSMRDMMFPDLRRLSRDMIREAFGISKFALGDVDDVNRATAEAAKAWFAEQLTVPRLDRFRTALNNDFLPMFGSTGVGYEFMHDNPVPRDQEAENAERTSKANAFATLVGVGVHPDDAADIVGLPRMRVNGTSTQPNGGV
jgi:HK97 family phage portal protein